MQMLINTKTSSKLCNVQVRKNIAKQPLNSPIRIRRRNQAAAMVNFLSPSNAAVLCSCIKDWLVVATSALLQTPRSSSIFAHICINKRFNTKRYDVKKLERKRTFTVDRTKSYACLYDAETPCDFLNSTTYNDELISKT